MTEEIIIDGVNVARCCKCYNVEEKILCGVSGICANNPNCYYKQLKRLEQERNDLQERLLTLADTYQETRNVCKRLEQENKQAHEDFICSDTALRIANTELDELKQENERLQSEIRQKKMTIMMNNDHYLTVDENNRKYRSALEEINKIAEPRFVNGLNEEADQYNQCMDRIQNKINEVLQ